MRIGRSRPQTVAVDGKIYVISGADYGRDPETHRGEVFDSKSDKWGSLSPPSPLPEAYGLFAVALRDLKKFVLGSYVGKFLYIFEAEEGRWKYAEEGWIVLILIDHGCCLPKNFEDYTFNWLYWPQAHQPYHTLDYLKLLDAEQDIELLKFHGLDLSLECACTLGISTMLLKKGAERGLTPFAVGSIMCREILKKEFVIEQIVREAKEEVLPATSEATLLVSVSLITTILMSLPPCVCLCE
ncbi:hypothetical protein RHMOL_Rhmol09G0267100 [Rhododendron molle]|uniref:Uncharacterized protein n=1 Tax=Rhododendron molle TaxID=49168 RepID=A0ACC0MHW7_RHOML|nr:hypothetical protein RHMOL_Rhmol09G0267100 [Rhododendron molle]